MRRTSCRSCLRSAARHQAEQSPWISADRDPDRRPRSDRDRARGRVAVCDPYLVIRRSDAANAELVPARIATSTSRTSWPRLGLLEKPDDFYDRGKSRVLQCSCRSPGCSDLLARLSLDSASVTWSDFEHVSADRSRRRPWSHEQLGPFRFERSVYAAALAVCKDHYHGPRLVPE